MSEHLPEPRLLTDNELIHRVKDHNDNLAFNELKERHSGIYMTIVNKYSGFSDKIQPEELKDDKSYNIYKWLLAYDETRGMKFSTYVGERAKYECLNILNKTPDKVDIDLVPEQVQPETPVQSADLASDIEIRARKVPNEKFWPIFKARHLNERKATWRQIGKDLGITHEWARQIYNMYIPMVRQEVQR